MIAVDTNILIYSSMLQSPWNEPAHRSMMQLWSGDARWMIPWPCLHEFFAVATNRNAYRPCLTSAMACELIEEWLSAASIIVSGESASHWPTLRRLIEAAGLIGSKVYDAKIAAICLQAGVTELWTADRDFSLFPDLRCVNPFVRRQ